VINGAHVIVYSKDPESDRAFFRDVLKFPAVDAGHGWLIFALPVPRLRFILPRRTTSTSCTSCATI
jgi:hypothetical protein